MQDVLGKPIETGDYVFGGTSSEIYQIVEPDKNDGFARAVKLGSRTDIKIFLFDFIKISKEDLTLFFMNRGYKQ